MANCFKEFLASFFVLSLLVTVGAGAQRFADLVGQKSGGKIKVKLLPRGTLGATFKRSVQFRAEALEYVAGYLVNDVSERKFQIERCGHWVKGRSCYTFDPIGPRLVTVSGYNRPHPQRLM